MDSKYILEGKKKRKRNSKRNKIRINTSAECRLERVRRKRMEKRKKKEVKEGAILWVIIYKSLNKFECYESDYL